MLLASFFAWCLAADIKLDIAYKTVDDKPILMDIYLPDKPVRKPVPVVFVIHGGAWISGSKKDMAALSQELANRGVAAVNLDYRLAPKYKWPSMLDDCQDAQRFISAHAQQYGLDPARTAAVGGSAGSHLALLLGAGDQSQGATKVPRLRGVFNMFGPADLTKDFSKQVADLVSNQVMGRPYDPDAEETKAFSPVNRIDKSMCPVYTLHGKADPLVPVIQASRLDEALKALGVPHTLVLVEGMGHGVTSSDEKVDIAIKTELVKALDWLVEKVSN